MDTNNYSHNLNEDNTKNNIPFTLTDKVYKVEFLEDQKKVNIVEWEIISMGFTTRTNLKVIVQLDNHKEHVNFNLEKGVFEIKYFFITLERAKDFAKFKVDRKVMDLNEKISNLNKEIDKWEKSLKEINT